MWVGRVGLVGADHGEGGQGGVARLIRRSMCATAGGRAFGCVYCFWDGVIVWGRLMVYIVVGRYRGR